MHAKDFLKWIGLKEKLHELNDNAPHINEREIWWASLGENIGFEINGKSQLFSRPVLILKKLSKGFYFVVPLTTQLRTGSWFVNYQHRGKSFSACLHQARPIDYRRLSSKWGELNIVDYQRIKVGFLNLFK